MSLESIKIGFGNLVQPTKNFAVNTTHATLSVTAKAVDLAGKAIAYTGVIGGQLLAIDAALTLSGRPTYTSLEEPSTSAFNFCLAIHRETDCMQYVDNVVSKLGKLIFSGRPTEDEAFQFYVLSQLVTGAILIAASPVLGSACSLAARNIRKLNNSF
jgi:hypothetical protein